MNALEQRLIVERLEFKLGFYRVLAAIFFSFCIMLCVMGAALTSSDTSAPYANGQQRFTDLTQAAAGQTLTVPNRTQQGVIQAIGGVVYFSHDGTFATATDFQIAAGAVFTYDGDLGQVNLLAAAANTDVNILYFR